MIVCVQDAAGGYQAVDPMYLKLCDDVQRMLRQYGSTIAGIKKLSDLIGTRRDSNATRRQLCVLGLLALPGGHSLCCC